MPTLDGLWLLPDRVKKIRDRANLLISQIDAYSAHDFFRSIGVKVQRTADDDVLALFEVPSAEGRARLMWRGRPEELAGLIRIERKETDEFEKTLWRAVLDVTVPLTGETAFRSPDGNDIAPQIQGSEDAGGDTYWLTLSLITYYLAHREGLA